MAQALGHRSHDLWLELAEMKAKKVTFLDSPISQAGLFDEAVEAFTQQFTAVKKQTEAIKHILPHHTSAFKVIISPVLLAQCSIYGYKPFAFRCCAATYAHLLTAASSCAMVWLLGPCIRLGYLIQFGRCLPRFSHILCVSWLPFAWYVTLHRWVSVSDLSPTNCTPTGELL